MAGSPVELLSRLVSQPVALRLKDGRTLTGRLIGVDEHLNLALEEAEESRPESTRRLGRVVLRGSNIQSAHFPGGAPVRGH
ncbi:MAG TPA: LSM domain-containing protein [Thermoplasmata archaeon]|nr:LSM domain-containing protein [Thermoplasmata archaeon]